MAAIGCKDTTPERIVRAALHRLGYRFRLHTAGLPGKPDIVLARHRAAVFVHGCFWHSHSCKRGRSTPATTAAFWRKKRSVNESRARRTLAPLRRAGWRVLVVWECQTRDPIHLAGKLVAFLTGSRSRVVRAWPVTAQLPAHRTTEYSDSLFSPRDPIRCGSGHRQQPGRACPLGLGTS